MFIQPSEEHPLPWRYVPLPFDGGGVNRFTYLIIAANDVEICCLCDQRTADLSALLHRAQAGSAI